MSDTTPRTFSSADGLPIHCRADAVVPVSSLVPHPFANKRHSAKQISLLAKIISRQGWRSPIVISSRSNFVVRGHARLQAAKKLGLSNVPVEYQDYADENEEIADLLADNRTAELSSRRKDLTRKALSCLGKSESFDLDLTGFDHVARRIVLAPIHGPEDSQEIIGETSQAQNVAPDMYCPFHLRTDCAHGPCSHKCLYCFVWNSHAALSWRGYKLVSLAALKKLVDKAAETNRYLFVGVCNDPFAHPESIKRLESLISYSQQKKVALNIGTKNPRPLLSLLDKNPSWDPSLLYVKVSFSVFTESAALLEPYAPSVSDRLDLINSLGDRGIYTYFRLQPMIPGYLDGLEEALDAVKAKCRHVLCEPLRAKVAWIKGAPMFREIAKVLTKHDCSFEKYFDEFGIKDQNGKLRRGLRDIIEYDPHKLLTVYKFIRDAAVKRGMEFGLCSGIFGLQFVHLNTPRPYCCAAPAHRLINVTPDDKAIAVRAAENRLDEIRFQSLGYIQSDQERLTELERIAWVNDPLYPIFPREAVITHDGATNNGQEG